MNPAAIETLRRYAFAYPASLEGIAERLEHRGEAARAKAYRLAQREIRGEIERAAEALGLL